jgi:competence protein ComFC
MIISALKKINVFLLDILFPQSCVGCGKQETYFCGDCAEKLCARGKIHKIPFPVISCCDYDLTIQTVIKYFKYHFAKDLAKPLGIILNHQFKKHFKSDKIVLVAVPLHKKRYKHRLFNQAEELAKEIGSPCDILIRTRHTKPQAKLNREQRLKNLKGAYALKDLIDLSGKIVVLVDDVCTTGTTLRECAKALKAANVEKIYGLVIAKGC